MSFLERIAACRRWNPEDYRPFVIAGRAMGRVGHGLARSLAEFDAVFEVGDRAVRLADRLDDFASRTAAVGEVLQRLRERGAISSWRDEDYPVLRRWGDPPLMKMERAAVPLFGVRGFGVHLNGLVSAGGSAAPGDFKLWVARRARDKATAPGKLDHLVAGGQPYGLGIQENLVKECAEEAGIPGRLVAKAVPVGAVSYRCVREEGLRDDVLFCFDLELPADFEPSNRDGEVEAFFLWPMTRVLETIAETEDFKFNVSLVILDLAIRRGLLSPDRPDYQAILEGLRRPEAA
ncbi:MAG: DUF4743 domain-containing protein [Kiloniellales bacterium]